jgi:hypothetical protein
MIFPLEAFLISRTETKVKRKPRSTKTYRPRYKITFLLLQLGPRFYILIINIQQEKISMKLSFLPFALIHVASAAIVVDQGPKFDYDAPLTGSSKCAMINVAMDESGAMSTEQIFKTQDAIPGMVEKLKGSDFNSDHVFVCSSGLGGNIPRMNNYQHLDCTIGFQ